MNLNKHDEILLKDLRFQPIWLIIIYILIGVVSFTVGFFVDDSMSKLLCGGGGFLIALGAEKLVSRRIRNIAVKLIQDKKP